MNKIQILGIDVGGTKIAAGLVDSSFRVRQVAVLPTSHDDLLGQLIQLIQDYEGFDGIGLGLPGQVLTNGLITILGNIPSVQNLNIKRILQKKFKKPIHAMNDAKAFALAEAVVGSGQKFNTVAGAILGTGIGVGFVSNKQLQLGSDGLAGELEHVIMPDGRMLRYYVRAGKPFRQAIKTKNILRTLMSMIVLSFNPEVIILGGGWGKLNGLQKIAQDAATNAGGYINKTPVIISKLKDAGIIGAALPLLKK